MEEINPTGQNGVAKKKKKSVTGRKLSYAEKDMKNALRAVRSGMKLSNAAVVYGVPKSTLSNKLTGKTPENRKMGPPSVLTEEEEMKIEQWILGNARLGFATHHNEVKNAVKRLLTEAPRDNPFNENRPGKKWLDLFMKRHPEIRKLNVETNPKSQEPITEKNSRKWFKVVIEYLTETNCLDVLTRPESIFYSNEIGVQTCPESGELLGPKDEDIFDEIVSEEEKEAITVLCTFSADGKFVPPMIVYPCEQISREIKNSIPNLWPIKRSSNGSIMSETFYEYIADVFHPWCLENVVPFPVIFFVDGHKSHLSLEVSEFCSENQIILYCLPPNASHIIQTCDTSIFKPLKDDWEKIVEVYKQSQEALTTVSFAPMFEKAFLMFFRAESIRNGFRSCGLFPFDYSNCISIRCSDSPDDIEDPSPSIEEFSIAKQVMEYVVGKAKVAIFSNIRQSNENCTDPIYKLWKVYADRVDRVQPQSNETRDFSDRTSRNHVSKDLESRSDDGTTNIFANSHAGNRRYGMGMLDLNSEEIVDKFNVNLLS